MMQHLDPLFGTFFLAAIEQLHHIFMEVPLSGLQLIDQRSERRIELTVVKNSFGV